MWLVIRQIYVSVISYVTTTLLKQSIIVIFSSFQSFKGFPFLTKVHLFVLLFPNEGHPSLAKRPFHFSLSLVKVSYSANRSLTVIDLFLFLFYKYLPFSFLTEELTVSPQLFRSSTADLTVFDLFLFLYYIIPVTYFNVTLRINTWRNVFSPRLLMVLCFMILSLNW